MGSNAHPPDEGALRPGFVWALALIALPLLILFGVGFVTDLEGPWRFGMAPAYFIGACVSPAVLARSAVRHGVPGGKAIVAAFGLGSLVLFLDLVIFSSAAASVRGFVDMAAVACGALALAMRVFGPPVAIPPRPDLPLTN